MALLRRGKQLRQDPIGPRGAGSLGFPGIWMLTTIFAIYHVRNVYYMAPLGNVPESYARQNVFEPRTTSITVWNPFRSYCIPCNMTLPCYYHRDYSTRARSGTYPRVMSAQAEFRSFKHQMEVCTDLITV